MAFKGKFPTIAFQRSLEGVGRGLRELNESLVRYWDGLRVDVPIVSYAVVTVTSAAIGTNRVVHKLGRKPQGAFQVGCKTGNHMVFIKDNPTYPANEDTCYFSADAAGDTFTMWVF